jgi:hypothetical protein
MLARPGFVCGSPKEVAQPHISSCPRQLVPGTALLLIQSCLLTGSDQAILDARDMGMQSRNLNTHIGIGRSSKGEGR